MAHGLHQVEAKQMKVIVTYRNILKKKFNCVVLSCTVLCCRFSTRRTIRLAAFARRTERTEHAAISIPFRWTYVRS
jgi:hypothetical protein